MNAHIESSLCSRCRVQLLPLRDASAAKLTRSEQRVFDLLCRGLPNKQIADRLVISENTVRYHLKQVYAKLGVRSRAHAMAQVSGVRLERAVGA